ncbi:ornithine--oxo-acid transaminase [Deinococcus cellulosilyticus]|uniref:ornithine aminotransferase n=1 Tax=Deinococcus cellulosilyticus (strain DSM 18568 / NBRC 106333 / KACC 11606 / 5516J-15) TaxID=1223518 RepID=A0A511MXG7_DEIC1|nr:ornithine--oxo-acid transaminase [Deinococcus cellulosilyticus]GEM44958.1 ornithine aminotransferase [Deinococcus cellulosilyticus NBRC 106333 = KACC 11606]
MNTQDYVLLDESYGAHNYHPLDVVIERGEGVWVYDVEGKKYLDCLSAYSAVNQGHCHPRILKSMIEQASKVTLTSRAFRNDQMGLFLKELCEFTGYEMALPMNTGAEAVETAIKAARKWGYQVKGIAENRAQIIVANGNFHGRTTTVVSFSTEDQYRKDFGPFTPGFLAVEYGNIEALKAAITPDTAAILLEPIQGEGGVIIPPEGYLKAVRALCDEHNILFIADEIQSGLGRSGARFACDHEGVRPDMVILGKALSGGFYPVSAVVADEPVLGLFKPGDHGSTFAGNPLGAAVAREALKVLQEENLIERSRELGEYLKSELEKIDSPVIDFVRGKGLWIGLVLKEPARPYCEALREMGILCKETHVNVIRIAPPLVVEKDELELIVHHFRQVLQSTLVF